MLKKIKSKVEPQAAPSKPSKKMALYDILLNSRFATAKNDDSALKQPMLAPRIYTVNHKKKLSVLKKKILLVGSRY